MGPLTWVLSTFSSGLLRKTNFVFQSYEPNWLVEDDPQQSFCKASNSVSRPWPGCATRTTHRLRFPVGFQLRERTEVLTRLLSGISQESIKGTVSLLHQALSSSQTLEPLWTTTWRKSFLLWLAEVRAEVGRGAGKQESLAMMIMVALLLPGALFWKSMRSTSGFRLRSRVQASTTFDQASLRLSA